MLLDPVRCGLATMDVTVRYDSGATHDFSHVLRADSRRVRFFVPIFSRVRSTYGDSEFLGIETGADSVECLAAERVKDLGHLPPIPVVSLAEDWRDTGELHQTYLGPPGLRGFLGWLFLQVRKLNWLL